MRWIYISPHFDDAVLSCGGLIWEQTQQRMPVEIWTLHAGEPAEGPGSAMITRVHALWQTGTPRQTVTQRRQEDHNAATLVGAQLKHFSLIDAIYRRGPNGELLYQRLNEQFSFPAFSRRLLALVATIITPERTC